jgi:hypothetical protein
MTNFNHVHYFGKDFNYDFFVPNSDDGFFDLSGVSTAPEIYIFNYSPSRNEAMSGTGSLQTISAWSNITTPYTGKRIAVTAIDDPDVNSTIYRYEYYIAINYYLQTSEQKQTDIRLLPMERVRVVHDPVSTNADSLQKIYSDIDDISDTTDQAAKIAQAIREIKLDLNNRGYDWASIWEPASLNDAVAYKALSLIMLDNMIDEADQYKTRHDFYERQYQSIKNNINLKVESEQNNKIKSEQTGNIIRVMR